MIIPKNISQQYVSDLTEKEAKEKLDEIRDAFKSIYENEKQPESITKLGNSVERLIQKKKGKELYSTVEEIVLKYSEKVKELVNKIEETDDFLKKLATFYNKSIMWAGFFSKFMYYMDKKYCEPNKLPELEKIIKNSFKGKTIEGLSKRISSGMNSMIMRERKGEGNSDIFVLKNLCRMFTEVDSTSYSSVFEKQYLLESQQFFIQESQKYFDQCTTVEYLRMVKKRLDEEGNRNKRCFTDDTAKQIQAIISTTMIESVKTAVVEKSGSGVSNMIKDFNFEDLRVVFDVLGNVKDGLVPTLNFLVENIKSDIEGVITEPESVEAKAKFDTNKMIEDVLVLKSKYEELCFKSFSTNNIVDVNFQKAVRKVYTESINKNDRISEYFAHFLNNNFTKLTVVNGKEEEFCVNCVNLVKYIIQKDRFEKIYRQLLGQRLLQAKEITEIENLFFVKLKNEFGREMLGRIEGMIKDIRSAKDLNENWKTYQTKFKEPLKLELNVFVLAFVNWPTFSNSNMILNEEMKEASKKFEKYYTEKHSGRKLQWILNQGNAQVKLMGFNKKYECIVTTYQFGILDLLKNNDKKTLKDIHLETKIPWADLKNHIRVLSDVSNILLREPSKKDDKSLKEETLFFVNPEFTSTTLRPDFSKFQVKVKVEEKPQEDLLLNQERELLLQSKIVKIMKARKTYEYKKLVDETIEHCSSKFLPQPKLVKKVVEDLIVKEYLARKEDDSKILTYIP